VKIKLDENLPGGLAEALAALGHNVDTVESEGLKGFRDENVWQAAQVAGRFFITQDLDFSDMRKYSLGTHEGLRLVRLAQPSREALLARIAFLFATESITDWKGCIVIATDRKVRVSRPA